GWRVPLLIYWLLASTASADARGGLARLAAGEFDRQLGLKLLEADPVGGAYEHLPLAQLKDRDLRVDSRDAAEPGDRIAELVHQLAVPVLRKQSPHDPALLGAHGQVHGAAHGRDRPFGSGVPVGHVPGG